jgi:hypothetical protein
LTITNLRVVQRVSLQNVEEVFLADALPVGKEIVVRKSSAKWTSNMNGASNDGV